MAWWWRANDTCPDAIKPVPTDSSHTNLSYRKVALLDAGDNELIFQELEENEDVANCEADTVLLAVATFTTTRLFRVVLRVAKQTLIEPTT